MAIFEAIGKMAAKINWKAVGTACLCLIGAATVVKGVADSQAREQMVNKAVAKQLPEALRRAAQNRH